MKLTTQQTIMAEYLDNVENVDFAIWYLLQKRIERIANDAFFGLYNPPYYFEEYKLSKKLETELEITRNYDDEKA
jgi:hypothetical protein